MSGGLAILRLNETGQPVFVKSHVWKNLCHFFSRDLEYQSRTEGPERVVDLWLTESTAEGQEIKGVWAGGERLNELA